MFCVVSVLGDVSHILYDETTTHPPPPLPYVFSYQAGRAPGHVDRAHTEVSDGSGVVKGTFSYVDPNKEVRTVNYVADENGFHPQLSHEPKDTEANIRAKNKHIKLYNKIAAQNADPEYHPVDVRPLESEAVVRATNKHLSLYEKIAEEHARIGAEQEAERLAFEATSEVNEVYEH